MGRRPRRTPPPLHRRIWDRAWALAGDGDGLSRPRRLLRGVRHLPGDWLLERSEFAGTAADVVMIAATAALGMSPALVLLANWIAGEIPGLVNIARSLAHRTPAAGAREWWRRDWTYFTRPKARQPVHIAAAPEVPLELRPGARIPGWLRALTAAASRRGRWSAPGVADDWLCARSRVAGWLIDHAIMLVGAFTVPILPLMVVDRAVVGIPGLLGLYIGLRNGDIRRALRGGVFQRAGDVVVEPAPAPRTSAAPMRAPEARSPADAVPAWTSVAPPRPVPRFAGAVRRGRPRTRRALGE